jgi:hypothetical protein
VARSIASARLSRDPLSRVGTGTTGNPHVLGDAMKQFAATATLHTLYWLCEHTGHPRGCWLLNGALGQWALSVCLSTTPIREHPRG